MVATFTARFNDKVTLTSRYISYRTRVIDGSVIYEFRVKGRKVCINSYKQNGQFPTMCIHMATHDDAMKLYNSMMAHWYPYGDEDEGQADEDEDQADEDEDQAELDEDEAELDEDEAELDEDEADEADQAELEQLEDEDDDMPPLIPVQTPLYHYWYKTMAF
jgi:hypothetical protein